MKRPRTSGSRKGWGRVGTLAVAIALTPLGAQENPKPRANPALVFLAPPPPGGTAPAEGTREFRATALSDLKLSGVFRLLDPTGTPASTSLKALPEAGASFLLKTVSHSLGQGQLLIESECINLQNQAVVLKKSFTGQAQVVGRMAHRMVDLLIGQLTGTPGAADSTLVFSRQTAPGIKEVFGMDRDGHNLRQLTNFGSLTSHPAVAGDGRMAVVTYKGGPPQIWGQRQPRGPFVRLHPQEGAAGLEISDLAWSPDGKRLAFVQDNRKGLSDIYVLDPATDTAVQLTNGSHSNRGPSWNPAGTELTFISDRNGAPQVFVMAADGSQARALTSDPAPKTCVAWSPGGDRIAYSAGLPAGSNLFTLTPGGEDRRLVTAQAEPVESLGWAPDGRWLVLGLKRGAETRLRFASLDGKTQDPAEGVSSAQFPQWIKNQAAAAPGSKDPAAGQASLAHPGAGPLS